ncbi:hypothetical protein [Mycobacterium sp.]|uniref:hypothetical protein n=1 Tax=Mycobacterium sp. TaxID=1785 RepID=UPI003F9E8044
MPISESTGRDLVVHLRGAYQHLLERAQRDHDLPDPRTLYWDKSAVGPEERERLIAAAKWRKPSMRHAKLLAGESVTVRWYEAIPPNRRRQTAYKYADWLQDPDVAFVEVSETDMVRPGDGRDYLAPGPAPE